jgi:hypothetical protein
MCCRVGDDAYPGVGVAEEVRSNTTSFGTPPSHENIPARQTAMHDKDNGSI